MGEKEKNSKGKILWIQFKKTRSETVTFDFIFFFEVINKFVMEKLLKPYAKFNILSFGIEEREVGNSSIILLQRFNISKFVRLAKPGGTSKINLIPFSLL